MDSHIYLKFEYDICVFGCKSIKLQNKEKISIYQIPIVSSEVYTKFGLVNAFSLQLWKWYIGYKFEYDKININSRNIEINKSKLGKKSETKNTLFKQHYL